MSEKRDKTGRVRRYDLPPLPGFANLELASQAAWLRELAERVYDQIEDLPREALDFSPADSRLSIGREVVHLAWAEANWVSRLSRVPFPPAPQAELADGALEAFSKPPAASPSARELIALCRRPQESFSAPALAPVEDLDTPFEAGGRTVNVRGVFCQLQWHWGYHSGQIGLLRLLWGSDYEWRNEAIVEPPAAARREGAR